MSCRRRCQTSRLGLRGVRSTFVVYASSQTVAAARSGSGRGPTAGANGSEPGRKSSPMFVPADRSSRSWISPSGSAFASVLSISTSTRSGTGSPRRRPSSPASTSAISALRPCPAPSSLTTYSPSSSASTSAGTEPPSRSGVT